MICSNCGFHNEPGDEFCGSCGQFLEWTGKPDPAAGPSSSGAPPPAAPIPPDDATAVYPTPPPPPAPPSAPPAMASGSAAPAPRPAAPPPATTAPVGGSTAFAGRAPDVICWNCSRRNPPGRSFCIQCGERLTSEATAPVAGATGVAAPGDGGRGRLIAGGIAVIALLLLAGLAAAVLFGGGPAPTATPTGIAVASPTPSTLLPSGSIAPTGLPSGSASPTTIPSGPPVTPSLEPTPEPTLEPTPEPTAPPTPKPTKKPTPAPTPLNCDAPAGDTKVLILTTDEPTKTISMNRGWCLRDVTFHNETISGGEVRLKLYLINDAVFIDFEPGFRYGYLEETTNEPGDYTVDIYYPQSYMENGIEPGTTIEFAVEECTAAPGLCGGSVRIEYEPGPPPAP